MYKGFELTLNDSKFLLNEGQYGDFLTENKKEIAKKFNEVLLSNGKIDADKIIEEWFPTKKYHVFISHSHKDIKLANDFANWLYDKFKITSFLDSHVWGHANILLQNLNDKYAKSGEDTYSYNPAISHAAHVYLMLSTALSEAIDKSECLFFLNTNNTLDDFEIKGSDAKSRTSSPWIMHELKTSALIRKSKSSDRKKIQTESVGLEAVSKSASFSFSVPTEHLVKIDECALSQWVEDCKFENDSRARVSLFNSIAYRNQIWKKEFEALDLLYNLSENEDEQIYGS